MYSAKVFVYGTLKKGEPNHHWLEDVQKGRHTFVSEGQTLTEYPLVVATKYNIPFLLDAPGMGHVSLFLATGYKLEVFLKI